MLTVEEHLTRLDEQMIGSLESRKTVYQLLVDFIGEEPTLENIVIWRKSGRLDRLSSMSDFAKTFCQQLQEVPDHQLYALFSSLRAEHRRLFSPKGELPVIPCETMYRAHEQKRPKSYAQEVRDAYADFSLYFKKMHGESDDHIAVELEFMAVIIEKMQNTVMTEERYERYMNGQSRFVLEHLQRWAVQFGQDLEQHTIHPVYKTLAKMLQDFVAKEAVWAKAHVN